MDLVKTSATEGVDMAENGKPMEVMGLRQLGPQRVAIVLRHDDKALSMIIDESEAPAIVLAMQGGISPRPMTHDLIVNLLSSLEAKVKEVQIHEVVDETFFGALLLETPGGDIKVDARPSDAIAIAVRVNCPIMVADKVLDQQGRPVEEFNSPGDGCQGCGGCSLADGEE